MKVAVLTGGVGGAKFVLGLSRCAEVSRLTAIVNTGDDFRHLGLHVSPDIDTLLYTLSGQDNLTQGWGREAESWNCMGQLKSLGGPTWFRLGDGDLALHILRTARLHEGASLSRVTGDFARTWGIAVEVLPMSDDPVATWLDTDEGPLAFQNYFVERACRPAASAIRFEGAQSARPAPGVLAAIAEADAVFVAPSNPFLSIDPILAVPGLREALAGTTAPVIAVSPLVGGKAVKGPTAKLMAELGLAPTNPVIAHHYQPLLDGLIHDVSDPPATDVASRAELTLMASLDDKVRVARAALAFARDLAQ